MATDALTPAKPVEPAANTARPALAGLRAYRAEWLTAAAFLAGWLSFTAGLAIHFGAAAWWYSIGVLLMSGSGWRLIGSVAFEGLYTLTREPDAPASSTGTAVTEVSRG